MVVCRKDILRLPVVRYSKVPSSKFQLPTLFFTIQKLPTVGIRHQASLVFMVYDRPWPRVKSEIGMMDGPRVITMRNWRRKNAGMRK